MISDWLSFEGTSRIENGKAKANPIAHDCPSNEVVTHRILSAFPQLVPAGFRVCQLPKEILSFARQAILIFKLSLTQRQKLDQKARTGFGEGGNHTATNTWVDQTQALLEYPERKPSLHVAPSLNCTEDPISQSQEALLDDVRYQWRA